MKLEFEQNIIHADLIEELDFKEFLSLFDLDIPLLPHKILRPMNQEKGDSHFRELSDFQTLIEQGKLDIERLVLQSRNLPLLDFMVPFFKEKSLEQYHLYSLGRFVYENRLLAELENSSPLASELNESCVNIQKVLEKYLKKGFSCLRHMPGEQDLSEQIKNLEQRLRTELSQYENEISVQTSLRMIYPYQREISPESENLSRILNCPLLSVTDEQNILRIDYRLPSYIEKTVAEKNTLSEKFDRLMQDKLEIINRELHPFSDKFITCYEERKRRVYYYALLWVKNHNSLCFPVFQTDFGCKLRNAELPSLKREVREYIPLNLELDQGSNVLFGANMTGKTSVLKTLYFHLTAIRMGLPVPAESVCLHFPEQVELHLRTSGDIRKKLSGFGQEMQFFTRDISSHAYILTDELFQSTDPVSGAELSEIFLSEFSDKELVFFCTSHYPGVLRLGNISLFRMKEADFEKHAESDFKLEDLLSKIPYKMERISRDKIDDALKQNRKALYIALNFPLPESVKGKIQDQIKKINT